MFAIILLTILITFICSVAGLIICLVKLLNVASEDNGTPPTSETALAPDSHPTPATQQNGTGLHFCKTRRSLDKIIKLGAPLDTLNEFNETALHVAVRRRKIQVLIGLLCHGAYVDSRNEHGETPLILACKAGDIVSCQLLLVFDAGVNVEDNRGLTPRHYAAGSCNKSQSQTQKQLPNASHIILAMLNAMGAKRCSLDHQQDLESSKASTKNEIRFIGCSDGCSPTGTFNGNSYNRWPDLSKESLNKRHMFEDMIHERISHPNIARNRSKAKRSRMLCIDGGGMRGVIVCQTMIELEKYLKRPLIDYFDWVGGTSVGAFVASALCLGVTLQTLRRISFDVKDEVFNGNKPYNSGLLEKVLKRTLGPATRMSDIKNRRLALSTVIADREPCQLLFFRNYKSPSAILESCGFSVEKYNTTSGQASMRCKTGLLGKSVPSEAMKIVISSSKYLQRPVDPRTADQADSKTLEESEQDPIVWQAVRASAAAPFFFKPYGPYLDGGIISNNPTMDMLTEFYAHEKVKSFIRARTRLPRSHDDVNTDPERLDLVVSFGTGRSRVIGRQAMLDFSKVTAGIISVFSPVELVRSLRAIRDLFKRIVQQSCQTEDYILDRAQAWCSSTNTPYFRVNPPLASIFSIDDRRDEQVINALWQTKLYMKSMDRQIRQLAEILDLET